MCGLIMDDNKRLDATSISNLVETFSKFNIHFDEGPKIGGKYGPYIQSQRLEIYKNLAKKLVQTKQLYPCFCTRHRLILIRKNAMKSGTIPQYDNRCRKLSEDEIQKFLNDKLPYTLRMRVNQNIVLNWTDFIHGKINYSGVPEGDPIMVKVDGYPTYHFAHVIDDHLMKITHILRGLEWQISTWKHIALYHAFGWNPPKYGHLPVLMDGQGKKLSKRNDASNCLQFLKEGILPETIIRYLLSIGLVDKANSTNFDFSNYTKNSLHVDLKALYKMNKNTLIDKYKTEKDAVIGDILNLIEK
ncbi:hypothetical protein A3Q56_03229 [Intoshia linei]|uniref:Glutamyl/glutaminyl-tRNA synthetase class Ib catalytic domain-containing protein n=1 Tax=Intoshia linei TaxID=1819745 RepID=A0A177B3V5_9BILA|nr:hypothetical protein A3Q56_03229 [Intoshia linei]